jgi:transposase InsO family protein
MTARLVTDALVMAIWRRGKPDALLHHSDRGSHTTTEAGGRSRRRLFDEPFGQRLGQCRDEEFLLVVKTGSDHVLIGSPSDASGFRLRNRIALLAAAPVSINFSKLCPEQKYLG